MAVRASYLAIALGGACGTFAALFGSSRSAPSTEAPAAHPISSALPLRPIAQVVQPSSSQPAHVAPLTLPVSTTASATPGPTAALSNAPPSTASVAAPALISSADPTPPPSTKPSLLHAEMHCDQRKAAACILAARSYETGSAGVTDAEKAAKYRKIALTLWISQCDHNSASSCATLTDMYRTGNGVPQSDRNADALLARTRELCHYNDVPVCHDLPAP